MIPNWTNHLKDPDEKERFRKHILGSKSIIDRQLEIMRDKELELNRSETDPSSYESPSWAAHQAHKNGFRECLQWMTKLLTLDHKEK